MLAMLIAPCWPSMSGAVDDKIARHDLMVSAYLGVANIGFVSD